MLLGNETYISPSFGHRNTIKNNLFDLDINTYFIKIKYFTL